MKEEYAEGIVESPTIDESTIPEQLRGAFGQAATTMQQLPVPIRDVVTNGLKVPLSELLTNIFTLCIVSINHFCYEYYIQVYPKASAYTNFHQASLN